MKSGELKRDQIDNESIEWMARMRKQAIVLALLLLMLFLYGIAGSMDFHDAALLESMSGAAQNVVTH